MTLVHTTHLSDVYCTHTNTAQRIKITDAIIHVRYTHICGNKTRVVSVLPKNDQIVEIKRIFHAAYHFVHCEIWVIIGIVWDAKNVGIAKKTSAKVNNVTIYQTEWSKYCKTKT